MWIFLTIKYTQYFIDFLVSNIYQSYLISYLIFYHEIISYLTSYLDLIFLF